MYIQWKVLESIYIYIYMYTVESGELFSGKDVRAAEKPVLMNNSVGDENRQGDVSLGVEGALNEEGRANGRFSSVNVVNLSCRSLSEEEINLLSKGLKCSPVPTGIDVAKLRRI